MLLAYCAVIDGEGLSGFDLEVVAATGCDVLAEPVGCQ